MLSHPLPLTIMPMKRRIFYPLISPDPIYNNLKKKTHPHAHEPRHLAGLLYELTDLTLVLTHAHHHPAAGLQVNLRYRALEGIPY